MNQNKKIRKPTGFSSVLAVLIGTVGVASLGIAQESLSQNAAIGVGVAGIGLALVLVFNHVRYMIGEIGLLFILVGLGVFVVGIVLVLSSGASTYEMLLFMVGLGGVFVVSLALLPIRGGGSRRLLILGCVLIVTAPILAAGMEYIDMESGATINVLISAMAVLMVWDLGENAIGLGEQVGRQAKTYTAEMYHSIAGFLVGGISIGGAYTAVVFGLEAPGQSLSGVFLLLISVILLVIFLHN